MAYLFTSGKFQAFSSAGAPLSGGKVYTYAAGTTSPLATYTTQAGDVANANPVILDSSGRADIWLGAAAYRIVVKTSADVAVSDTDNIYPLVQQFAVLEETFTASAAQTLFNLSEFTYVVGNNSLSVVMNGIMLERTVDYEETSASSFTLRVAAEEGDRLIARAGVDMGANLANNAATVVYTGKGAGAVATTVQARLRNICSVADYAPVGDGVADDSAAIQAAIDAMSAAGGGTVLFPQGTYGVGVTVTIPSNVRLLGSGVGVSTIKALAALAITDPMLANVSGDTGAGVRVDTNITLEHLTFDGSGRTYPAWDQNTDPPTYGGLSQANARGYLVRFYSAINTRVLSCEFKGHQSLVLAMCGGLNELVQGCTFSGNGKVDDISPCIYGNASFPNSTPAVNLRVVGNSFYNCNRGGVRFAVGSGTVVGNTFDTLKEYGIHVESGSDVTISGNTIKNIVISDIVANGIEIENSAAGRVVIDGNIFNACGLRAVAAGGVVDFAITNNIIYECGGSTNYPALNGPLNYAAGRAASDPVDDFSRCAISLITSDTDQVKQGVIEGNVIRNVSAGMRYGILFGKTGTPTLKFQDIACRNNVITGPTLAKYYFAAGVRGTNVVCEDDLGEDTKRLGPALPLDEGYGVTGSAALTNLGTNAARTVAFDAAATEDWQWVLAPRQDRPQGEIIAGVRIYAQKPAAAGTGNVVWQVGTIRRDLTTSIGSGAMTTENFTVAVAADSDQTTDMHDLTLASEVTYGAGEFLVFRLARLGADGADTWGSDYHVIAVQLIYK